MKVMEGAGRADIPKIFNPEKISGLDLAKIAILANPENKFRIEAVCCFLAVKFRQKTNG